jgi:integrase
MAKALTDVGIKNLKPGEKAREIPDGRGLFLWLGASGIRSFVVRFRHQGRTRKLTLGRWVAPGDRPKEGKADPKVGEPMSLLQARKLAADVMNQVRCGGDPAADKKQGRLETKQAMADTFEAIALSYMQREGSKLRGARRLDQMLRRQAFPAIGQVPITQLKKSQIVKLLDKIQDENGPVAADRLLALVRRILNWHAGREDDYRPPLLRVKPRKSASEQARDRVLDDRELAAVWQVSGEWDDPFASLVRFLLLTAARRNEAALMPRSEVNDGVWTLPAARNKVARDLVRPLSRMAIEVMPRVEGSKYVFTYDGRRGMTGFSKPKKRFDERVAEVLGGPIPNWTLHDLRRTARSLMSRAGVLREHAERCLGHAIGSVVEQTYDRHRYQAEMLAAYEKLAHQIETITNPPTDNVVPFKAAE